MDHYIYNLTINNPLFMLVLFGSIWYLPGLIISRRREYLTRKKKKLEQEAKISRLYPSVNKDIDSN